MIILAPNHRTNTSAPVVKERAVLATTNDQTVQSAPTITAFIRPTGCNYGVFYSVDVTINYEVETKRVRPDDILKWVSLNELTRFEHRQFLDEQAREKAKFSRRQQRRGGKRPSTIRPLGPVEETEASANDDPLDALTTSSTPYPGQKRPRGRPRGRPRKQLFSVQIHPTYEDDVGSSSAPTNPRKRRRGSSESSHSSDQITSIRRRNGVNNHASAGRRQDANYHHVSLPQVKKRVKKSEYQMFSISSDAEVDNSIVPTSPTLRETLACSPRLSRRSASEELVSDPIFAYSDLDAQSPERRFAAYRVTKASTASGHLDGISQRRSDAIAPTRLSLDPEASDENALADVSSEEDELATLQTSLHATPRNRLQQPTSLSPRTTIRIGKSPVSVTSSSDGQDDILIPPQGREASLDLGAPSSSEDSMRQSPFRLQSRSNSQQDATAANQTIDASSDSMISSRVRLQNRTAESHRPPGEIEIVELSSNQASDNNKDFDQSVAEDESGAESEATVDDPATEPEDAYADLVIPSIPSSQSFRNQASSVSSDEFTNIVVQKSEARATTRRAHLNASEPQGSRDVLNGTSRSNRWDKNPTISPSNQTPTQRAFNIPIQSRSQDWEDSSRSRRGRRAKHTAANQLHPTTYAQQEHRSYRNTIKSKQSEEETHPIRPQNPFQQFSQHPQHPTQADSLASMGAGQTFPSTSTTRQGQASTSASLVDSSTQSNPYGRPLPLHPVTPPVAFGHKGISHMDNDTNGVTPRFTTQKRSRQSMTPLFPRRAIIPDLLGSNGRPSKRKEKILSTQQFQA